MLDSSLESRFSTYRVLTALPLARDYGAILSPTKKSLGALGEVELGLRGVDVADRLALHLSRVVERAIASLDKSERVAKGTSLARQLVNVIVEATQPARDPNGISSRLGAGDFGANAGPKRTDL